MVGKAVTASSWRSRRLRGIPATSRRIARPAIGWALLPYAGRREGAEGVVPPRESAPPPAESAPPPAELAPLDCFAGIANRLRGVGRELTLLADEIETAALATEQARESAAQDGAACGNSASC